MDCVWPLAPLDCGSATLCGKILSLPFPGLPAPHPPPWRNPRKGKNEILPSGNPDRNHTYMTSAKLSDFLSPSPLSAFAADLHYKIHIIILLRDPPSANVDFIQVMSLNWFGLENQCERFANNNYGSSLTLQIM